MTKPQITRSDTPVYSYVIGIKGKGVVAGKTNAGDLFGVHFDTLEKAVDSYKTTVDIIGRDRIAYGGAGEVVYVDGVMGIETSVVVSTTHNEPSRGTPL
jgi:hypothetical protein